MHRRKAKRKELMNRKGDVSFLKVYTRVCVGVGVQGQQCYLISGNGCATV